MTEPKAASPGARGETLAERSPGELAAALHVRASLLSGERWEIPATVAMMQEAADRISQLTADLAARDTTIKMLRTVLAIAAPYIREMRSRLFSMTDPRYIEAGELLAKIDSALTPPAGTEPR